MVWKRSAKSTQAPEPHVLVRHMPSAIDSLVVEAEFPKLAPETVFDYLTKPELLVQWWPKVAEVAPHVDGAYLMSWPHMGWNLRGIYTTFERGQQLDFTWKWDHEPDFPERRVHIRFEAYGETGSKIELTQGAYETTLEDQKDRANHWKGWKEVLTKLQELPSTPA